jgi:hypothetical protein
LEKYSESSSSVVERDALRKMVLRATWPAQRRTRAPRQLLTGWCIKQRFIQDHLLFLTALVPFVVLPNPCKRAE